MNNPEIGSSQHASSMQNPSTPENSLSISFGLPYYHDSKVENGITNPEIGSRQHASSMENPSFIVNPLSFPIGHPCYYDPKVETAKRKRRSNRKCDDIWFRRCYDYDESFEQKTCIWSGGTYSWQDKSSGIMWVAVHGMDAICVVTMTGDVDMTRVRSVFAAYTKETVLCAFRKTVICEIEDLRSTLHQRFGKSIKKPFGVVSVIPRTNDVDKESDHEASSDDNVKNKALNFFMEKFLSIQPPSGYDEKEIIEFQNVKRDLSSTIKETILASSSFAVYDEKKAIKFLEEKMESNMDLTGNETIQASSSFAVYDEKKAIKFSTANETIQIAVSAFQHLLQKKFKANEIEVSVMDPYYKVYSRDALDERAGVKELEIIEIEELLAVINGPDITGSGVRIL